MVSESNPKYVAAGALACRAAGSATAHVAEGALACRAAAWIRPRSGGSAGFQPGETASKRKRALAPAGFTLIELMIVISIILILISVAAPMYQRQIVRSREAVLRQDLYTMRLAIDNFTVDKERAPQSLQDLVDAGYLGTLPKDPFTDSTDTWTVDQEDVLQSVDQTQPGISNVHSGSSQISTDGTAYSSW